MKSLMKKYLLLAVAFALASLTLLSAVAVPLYAQESALTLEACKLKLGAQGSQEMDARCGVLTVPENWSQSDGRTIEIHVAVVPKKNPDSQFAPIFHLEGGPGASAITNYSLIWFSAYADLNRDHDIVLIDQRGTGKSALLQCAEYVDNQFADLAKASTAEEDLAEGKTRLQTCLTRLAATADPMQYTSSALAKDTDAVRQALGYEKINLFGSSYGTWLAQFIMAQFGEHINAVVLEGTVGPWNNPYLDVARNTADSLNKAFALCAADPVCDRTYPDLPGLLDKALALLKDKPVEVVGTSSLTGKTHPVVITQERLLQALRAMPGQGSLIASIPSAVYQASFGAYNLPAAVLIASAEQPIAIGMHYSVTCAEAIAFVTEQQYSSAASEKLYGVDQWEAEGYREACSIWRSAELSEAEIAPVRSDVPTLLLAGAYDPLTPPRYAEETASRLANSTLALFPYQGHGVLPSSGCAQTLVSEFLKAPDQPLDTACTANDVKPVFVGAYGFKAQGFTDPFGTFTAAIPEGWSLDPTEGNGANGMTFVVSPATPLPEYIGIGVFKGATNLQEAATKALAARFDRLDEQATISQLGTTITQYSMKLNGEIYIGALVSFDLLGQRRAVFYAAPSNIFTAGFSEAAVGVFGGIIPR